jgi:hypothetical protein
VRPVDDDVIFPAPTVGGSKRPEHTVTTDPARITQIAREYVASNWPSEMGELGENTFRHTVERAAIAIPGAVAEKPQGGHDQDITATIELIAAVVGLIRELIEAHEVLSKKLGRAPSEEELKTAPSTVRAPEIERKRADIARVVRSKMEHPGA